MKCSLDGRSVWDWMDFDHCSIFFSAPRCLPEVVSFDLWGVILHTARNHGLAGFPCGLPVGFDIFSDNVIISGSSVLSFHGLACVELDVSLWSPGNTKDFWRDSQGKDVRLSRTWGQQDKDEGDVFDFGGFLAWPAGECEVSVKATGPIVFEFDSDDCLTADEQEKLSNRRWPPWLDK